MENVPGMTMDAAYDVARKEFYALRHEEEVAAQIAREEARMVGGYFGKGMVALGMAKEDAEFDRWRAWAMEEAERSARDRAAAYTSFGDDALDTTAAAGEASEAA